MKKEITNTHEFDLENGRHIKLEVYRAKYCLAWDIYIDGELQPGFHPITSCWSPEGLERQIRFLAGESLEAA